MKNRTLLALSFAIAFFPAAALVQAENRGALTNTRDRSMQAPAYNKGKRITKGTRSAKRNTARQQMKTAPGGGY